MKKGNYLELPAEAYGTNGLAWLDGVGARVQGGKRQFLFYRSDSGAQVLTASFLTERSHVSYHGAADELQSWLYNEARRQGVRTHRKVSCSVGVQSLPTVTTAVQVIISRA